METVKLYYDDPYMMEFSATVTACTEENGAWLVTLDRTAFYPTGGGQPCDHGRLGASDVTDVWESGGIIVHRCTAPIDAGTAVTGEIDWERRFDFMQQHSGEHIISGIICRRFDCDNVGFHIGADAVTIDFSVEMTLEQLRDAELEANGHIWKNTLSEVLWPEADELKAIDYRSKKELESPVRLVRFGAADTCACCGTHVKRAGEVGLIKLLSCQKFREGVRIELLCGKRAFEYLDSIQSENAEISKTLSAPPLKTADAVMRLQSELESERYRAIGLENRLFAQIAEARRGTGAVLLFEPGLGPDALRRLATAVSESCCTLCAAFSGEEGNYKYAITHQAEALTSLAKALNSTLNGRGGGRGGLIQGSLAATKAEIENFFKEKA